MTSQARPFQSAVIALCVCTAPVLLAGCERHNGKSSSQVVAKVGSYEITQYEVNNAFARLPEVPPEKASEVRAQVLEGLITQRLAVNQAQVLKLDRSPAVAAALESARREVLARAFYEQIQSSQPEPTADEVRKYYNAHPELFSARRLYVIKSVAASNTPEVLAYAQEFANSGKNIDQFTQWLQDKGIRFNATTAVVAPESVPLDSLARLAQTKDGGILLRATDSSVSLAQILNSRSAPLNEAESSAAIVRFLDSQRGKEAVDQEVARLRSQGKVELLGEFATTPAVSGAPGDTPSGSPNSATGGK